MLTFVIPFALIIGSDDDWGNEDWEADVFEGDLSEDVDGRKVEANSWITYRCNLHAVSIVVARSV